MHHFAAIAFVIVAGQVNHPMQNQHAQLRGQPTRAPPRVSPRSFRRNDNITYVTTRAGLVRCVIRRSAASSGAPSRKRQHVSWSLSMSKLAIHPRHGPVPHKTNDYAFFAEPNFSL